MTSQQPLILYVEDEMRSRRVMQMVATDMDIRGLILFADSSDFLRRVQALNPQPDLVFLDIHIRPYSGYQMLDMLRALPQFTDTPIVAMTASVMNEEVEQLRNAGFSGCLAKPLDMETFPDSVRQILDGEHVWRIAS